MTLSTAEGQRVEEVCTDFYQLETESRSEGGSTLTQIHVSLWVDFVGVSCWIGKGTFLAMPKDMFKRRETTLSIAKCHHYPFILKHRTQILGKSCLASGSQILQIHRITLEALNILAGISRLKSGFVSFCFVFLCFA